MMKASFSLVKNDGLMRVNIAVMRYNAIEGW